MNGKAKIDFLEWYWENYINPLPMTICKKIDLSDFFDTLVPIFQKALIIEWLDSVGLRISIVARIDDFGFLLNHDDKELYEFKFSTRQEATEKSIETAMEIYNDKQK